MKAIWAIAGIGLISAAGVATAGVVASPGGEEEAVQQIETATPARAGQGPQKCPSHRDLRPQIDASAW